MIHRCYKYSSFCCWYLTALVVANLRLARDLLSVRPEFAPGVHFVKLEPLGAVDLLILANLISLTPGTLTVDLSEDSQGIVVHALHESYIRELEDVLLPKFYSLVSRR